MWDNPSDKFSSIFAITVFVVVFFFPLFVWWLLWTRFDKLNDELSIIRYGSMYLELKTDSKTALLYNIIYMLRRLMFATVAILFGNWPFAQI